MKRKILSLILVFAMTVSLLTVGTGAVEPTYGDTAGHWAESSIERWSGHGIIQGSNGLFDPNGQLTCAQLATILAKLLKLPAAKDAGFTDNTADAWYYDAINRCAAAGILNGNGDGTVTPEAPITRERAMVMLARALGIEPIRKPDLTKYTDAAQVSAYAQGYVAALIEAGIVGGVTADQLAPQNNITRAATVTILDRAISTYADKAGATVKADGKGLVLVVAENVKITNAPEGTKIVVADGATGLTVNGKSVSDDQTYIVPKATTGSGSSSSGGHSHTHSYNETTHKCSCGAFAPAVVATIGNTNGYLTLKEAVTAATNGQTVKLVKDVELSEQFAIDKAITLDLGSHTLKSTWLMSGGQRYAIISNAPLTIQNGTVAVGQARAITAHDNLILDSVTVTQELTGDDACIAFSGAGKAYLITNSTIKGAYAVCNFADNATITISGSELIGTGNVLYHNGNNCGLNLTVIDTKITGTGDGCGVYLSGSTKTLGAGGLQKATFKNCTITGTNGVETKYTDLTMENCTVTATGTPSFKQNNDGPATSGFAVVSTDNTMSPNTPAPDGKTTIAGNKGSYTGLIGLRTFPNILTTYPDMKESTYAIAGGTFDHNPNAQYIAAGYEAKGNGNGTWTVSEKANVTLVAQVGVNKYESLADALAAAEDGDTVKLVGDTTLRSSVEINKSITLDLNGKTIHYTGADQKATNPRMSHRALNVTSGTVTIKNGAITTTVVGTIYPPQDDPQAEGSEFDAIIVKSGAVVTLEDMNITINDKHGSCLYVFEGGKATVKSGSYTNKNTSGDKLLLNQKDIKPQAIFVEGGTFNGRNPESGDNSLNPSTFLAPDYKSVETSTGSGVWTVEKKNWDDYDADGTTMPAGVKITSRDNNGNVTVTLEDEDAFKYFTQIFDMDAACSARETALDNGATRYPGESVHNHLNIWYRAYHQVHVEMAKSVNLGGMEVTPFTEYSTFDGKGFTISNAKVSGADTSVGFFGGNPITNVKMDSISVTANDTQYAGVISGFNSSSITNVTVTRSTVTGGKNTGAIVGNCYVDLSGCTVENCTISGQYKVGGLAGYVCREDGQKRIISNNTLRNVTLKGENLISGKSDFVIGQAIGNWNARSGGSINVTTIENVTGADSLIGKIESDVATPSIDGKVQVGSQEALANAISSTTAGEETSIKLAAGTYTLPSLENKSITISGTKNTVIDMKGEDGKGVVNKANSASFDGVTVAFANENYKGFQHTGKLTYKNCTIKGLQFLYADDVEFINCTFEQEDDDSYHIWTYGAKNVTFTGCTFNSTSNSKAVLCYIEGAGNTFTRTFNSCTFKATGTAEKSAIMINPTANAGTNTYTVNINNCTATGYAENGISGQTIVGVKETVKDTIIINIDGKQIYSHFTAGVS